MHISYIVNNNNNTFFYQIYGSATGDPGVCLSLSSGLLESGFHWFANNVLDIYVIVVQCSYLT